MVASEQEFILASCCGSPMSRNSVLEELRVNKLAVPSVQATSHMYLPILTLNGSNDSVFTTTSAFLGVLKITINI